MRHSCYLVGDSEWYLVQKPALYKVVTAFSKMPECWAWQWAMVLNPPGTNDQKPKKLGQCSRPPSDLSRRCLESRPNSRSIAYRRGLIKSSPIVRSVRRLTIPMVPAEDGSRVSSARPSSLSPAARRRHPSPDGRRRCMNVMNVTPSIGEIRALLSSTLKGSDEGAGRFRFSLCRGHH